MKWTTTLDLSIQAVEIRLAALENLVRSLMEEQADAFQYEKTLKQKNRKK